MFEEKSFDVEELEDSDVWEQEASDIPIPTFKDKSDEGKLPEGLMDNLNPMEQALKEKTDAYASKIIQLVMQYKIQPDDPIFVVFVAMQELEMMMVDVPMLIEQVCTEYETRMSNMFHKYFGSSESEVRERYQVSLMGIKHEIAQSVRELIETTRKEQFAGNLLALGKMMLPSMAISIGAIGLGVLGTLQYHQIKIDTLLGSGKLTPQQYSAMEWAMSSEGQQAREIMTYNAGYVGKTCIEDAEAMGLRLNYGSRVATSGICALFIEPPNKRRYEQMN